MRLSRLHVTGPLRTGQTLSLPRDPAHYVARVLRLKPGDGLVVFDGNGGEFQSIITTAARHTVQIRVGEHRPLERESPLAVTLALGISRGERMDYAIQKAVELGVDTVAPLLTERCGVHLEPRRASQRQAHWQRIGISACEQCGRNRLPEIRAVSTLGEWLTTAPSAPGLVLAPDAERPITALEHPGQALTLLIGPEGGLSAQELDLALKAGFQAIRLGPRVLRAETAAVAALTAVQTCWGDLGEHSVQPD